MKPLWLRRIEVSDRGLAYGDGCFETLRLRQGRCPLRALHRTRLIDSARRLGIALDPVAFDIALEQAAATGRDAVLKLILTRGAGGRGYAPPDPQAPRLMATLHPLPLPQPDLRAAGLELMLCPEPMADQPALAGIKHLNRLEQVLARQAVARAGVDEGLMLDVSGRPVELTAMNLFARFGNRLWTPSLQRCGVGGVARRYILSELSAQTPPVMSAPRKLADLRRADEVFACNSVVGILPVRKLGLWQWLPGPVTRNLQEALDRLWA